MLSVVAKLHHRGFLRHVHAKESTPTPPRLIYSSALARPGHTFEMLMLNANLSFIIKNGGNAISKG